MTTDVSIQNSLQNESFGIFGQDQTFIEGLFGIVDAHPDESHELKVTKTAYPIETGSSLTDNAVIEPRKLTLEGWISDLLYSENALVQIEGRPIEGWNRLVTLAEDREPLTVVTTLQVYENMLITNLSSVKNADTGETLRFIVELEEILFSETRLTRLPPSRIDRTGRAADKTSQVDRGRIQSPVLDARAENSAVANLNTDQNVVNLNGDTSVDQLLSVSTTPSAGTVNSGTTVDDLLGIT